MSKEAKILVVEDEKSMRDVLGMLLESEGYEVHMAEDGTQGMEMLADDIYDVVITDIKMPGATGFEVLRRTRDIAPETLVIMITAFGTMQSGVEAMKQGAYDYIHKPFKIDEIRIIIRNAVDKRRLTEEVTLLRETVRSSFEVENIIGRSASMQKVLKVLPKISASLSNVLVTGESGTGKELIAAALHNMSGRADRNFVAINCASLPEGLLESEIFGHMKGSFTGAVQNKMGLFEVANDGTLFLDEIGEMPLSLQSKLLRAIEYGSFRRVGGTTDLHGNARIIAATNRDLKKASEEGSFREDLFFRLNVIPVHIPPLRERREDIPLLVEHFVNKHSPGRPRQFTGSALNIFVSHTWPGNVRELENTVERVLLFADTDLLTERDIPDDLACEVRGKTPAEVFTLGAGVELDALVEDLERKYICEALRAADGNRTEAAKLLGLTPRSLRHKMTKYAIR